MACPKDQGEVEKRRADSHCKCETKNKVSWQRKLGVTCFCPTAPLPTWIKLLSLTVLRPGTEAIGSLCLTNFLLRETEGPHDPGRFSVDHGCSAAYQWSPLPSPTMEDKPPLIPANLQTDAQASYVDIPSLLDASFSPHAHANTLVHSTNNPSDTPIDLSTPLSRVLFDVQEIDTRIDSLTSHSALPLLSKTRDDVQAGGRILGGLQGQVKVLSDGYERLKREVWNRCDNAQELRVACERLWRTVRLSREVGRCIGLGRQLEVQMTEMAVTGPDMPSGHAGKRREDHRALLRAGSTIASLHQILSATSEETEGLDRITVVRTLRTSLLDPAQKRVQSRAESIVGQFSMSALTGTANTTETSPNNADALGTTTPSFAQTEDTRARAISALQTLYLLSPSPTLPGQSLQTFEPSRLVSALQDYLRRSITSSLAGLSSALAALPKLDRALLETAARCQNIVALELLLSSIKPLSHPFFARNLRSRNADSKDDREVRLLAPDNLLQPLLTSLDTSSLPSYFWRSMASQLTGRVQKIMREGGVSARTLRSHREKVGQAMRGCVGRGSRLPANVRVAGKADGKEQSVGGWEREAAVMVGSVMHAVGR